MGAFAALLIRRLSAARLGSEFQAAGRDHRFTWPAWTVPLDYLAIDALLDLVEPDEKSRWSRAGVHAAWQGVQFKPKATADTTRAFGSVRI